MAERKKKESISFATESEKKRFQLMLEGMPVSAILWPHKHAKLFPAEFVLDKKRKIPGPLIDPQHRLHFLEERIRSGNIDHPSVYVLLTLFREDAEVLEHPDLILHIDKLRQKIKVPPALKKTGDTTSAILHLLSGMESLLEDARKDAVIDKEAALLQYADPEYINPSMKKKMDELIEANNELTIRLKQEVNRADLLDQEVHRLSDLLVSASTKEEGSSDEVEDIKRDYAILSQRYDSLVNKNIELSNRLERAEGAKHLEVMLDLVREKINRALRMGAAGSKAGDEILLRGIKQEIEQLQRARTYLGRALYDVGILYLRIGDKEKALPELRAARELGIEDPETNRILNS